MAVDLSSLTAAELRAIFDAPAALTVGFEEELFLCHPETLDLLPRAQAVLDRLGDDGAYKPELPAAQLEIVTTPAAGVPGAAAQLVRRRAALADACRNLARPVATGVHPFAARVGPLSESPAYADIVAEYAPIARGELVCAFQVHVAVGDAERTLAIYNALRGFLPELAALAANGPFHAGEDTGLASVRPKLAEGLPRQGIPPVLPSWEAYAEALRWGARAGGVPEPRWWWWELRPHVGHGTLELRVPDAQRTAVDAAGVAAVAHSLVGWLSARAEGGDLGAPAETWRIAENRWSACRHGVEGRMADLKTGAATPTRERLHALLDVLEPTARGLGCAAELGHARGLVEANGALRQREEAAERGLHGLTAWLADGFTAG